MYTAKCIVYTIQGISQIKFTIELKTRYSDILSIVIHCTTTKVYAVIKALNALLTFANKVVNSRTAIMMRNQADVLSQL